MKKTHPSRRQWKALMWSLHTAEPPSLNREGFCLCYIENKITICKKLYHFSKLHHYTQLHIIRLADSLAVIPLARHAGGVAYLSLRLGNKVQTMPYIPALPSHLPRQMEVFVCANPRIKSLFAKTISFLQTLLLRTIIHNLTCGLPRCDPTHKLTHEREILKGEHL